MNSKTYYLAECNKNTNSSDDAVFASKYNWNNDSKILIFIIQVCITRITVKHMYYSSYTHCDSRPPWLIWMW